MDEYVDLATGRKYRLTHLGVSKVSFPLKIDGVIVAIDLVVHYANHCYTRSRRPEEGEHLVLFRERLSDGTLDERIFCPLRWQFSKGLPAIVAALNQSLCYGGRNREIFYRVKSDIGGPSTKGWYICGRLGVSAKRQQLFLSIRSIHHRTNQPHDIRRPGKRFYEILIPFYQAQKATCPWV